MVTQHGDSTYFSADNEDLLVDCFTENCTIEEIPVRLWNDTYLHIHICTHAKYNSFHPGILISAECYL